MSNTKIELPHYFPTHVEAMIKEFTPEKLRRVLRNQIAIAPGHIYEFLRTNRDEEVLKALNLIVEWGDRMQLITDIYQRYPNEISGMRREIPSFDTGNIGTEFIARSATIFFAAEKNSSDISTVMNSFPQELKQEISLSQTILINN